jgi:hypothetical protein
VAILEYLEETRPEVPLLPTDPLQRAQAGSGRADVVRCSGRADGLLRVVDGRVDGCCGMMQMGGRAGGRDIVEHRWARGRLAGDSVGSGGRGPPIYAFPV